MADPIRTIYLPAVLNADGTISFNVTVGAATLTQAGVVVLAAQGDTTSTDKVVTPAVMAAAIADIAAGTANVPDATIQTRGLVMLADPATIGSNTAQGGAAVTVEALARILDLDSTMHGKSAYQIWLDNGHTGTEAEFTAWLKGDKGDQLTEAQLASVLSTFTASTTTPGLVQFADADDVTSADRAVPVSQLASRLQTLLADELA